MLSFYAICCFHMWFYQIYCFTPSIFYMLLIFIILVFIVHISNHVPLEVGL